MKINELFSFSAEARVISYLIDQWHENPDKLLTRVQICEDAKIHYRTAVKVFPQILKLGLLQEQGKLGKITVYKVGKSEFFNILARLEVELMKLDS